METRQKKACSARSVRQGFTLIELLVVISIISLLISIITAGLQDAKRKSQDTSKVSSLQEVRTALQLFFTDRGYYPATTNLSSDLIGSKFIVSIVNGVVYAGLPVGCEEGACTSYHLGIALAGTDNKVLIDDKDSTDGFDGNSTDCAGTNSGTDKCYDLEP